MKLKRLYKMTEEEIKKMVRSNIDLSLSGLSIEKSKFDFKREWYNLKSDQGKNEFIKDTTSMVNTYGLDGVIVIGFDDETKEFTDSKLPVDPSELIDLINKRVDRLFDVNTYDVNYQGHSLSVIHIPPSMDKPHFIRNFKTYNSDGSVKNSYENVIRIRKNTETYFSTRYDLDLMLWDNKNVIPDYRILSSFNDNSLSFHGRDDPKCIISLTLENVGKRPVGIIWMKITFQLYHEDQYPNEIIECIVSCKQKNIIIPSGEMWNNNVEMSIMNSSRTSKEIINDFQQHRFQLLFSPLTIQLCTGKIIESELIKTH
jgi:hypothetical protein